MSTPTATYRAPRPYTVRHLGDGRPNAWVVLSTAGALVAAFPTRKAATEAARHFQHRARARFAAAHPRHHEGTL